MAFHVKPTPKTAPKPIPPPPETEAMDGYEFFAAIQDILNEGTGQIGDPGKKFITLDDLTDPDLIKYLNSQPVSMTRPEPAIQDRGLTTDNAPDAPRNLTILSSADATRLGAFCNHLTWDNPSNEIDDIASIEVWIAKTQNRSDAVFTGLVTYPGDEYQHGSTNPAQTYYYWIRCVNWAGQYSEWEPSSDQGGLVVKGSETIGETADKIVNALKGEAPSTYAPATEYQIGEQVKFEGADGSVRSYECIRDEEDKITDGDISADTRGSELITAQVDRDFNAASNWINVDVNSYNETGDLTITADEVGQSCKLPDANMVLTVGKLYTLTFEVDTLVKSWRITDENDTQTILQEVITGTNTAYFIYSGTAGGGIRIIANSDTSSANFDNFSCKEVTLTSWSKTAPGFNVGLDEAYISPMQASVSPLKDEIHCDGTQAGTADFSQTGASFTNAVSYIARFTIRDYYDGSITLKINGTSGTARSANGNYQQTIVAGAAGGLVLTATADFQGTIDSIMIVPATSGTGITGHEPEYYYPLLWKRIGILTTGAVDGEDVVGIDGNLVVDGTILARHMEVDSLSAVTANLGTVTAGVAKSADGKFKIDFNERWLKVWDEAGTLRVHLGFIED